MCSSTAQINSWLTLGKAALKSKNTMAARGKFKDAILDSNSMSRMLASMLRPLRKPRCAADTLGAYKGSTATRYAPAKSRLSVLTTLSGLVESPLYTSSPPTRMATGFFGRQLMLARLKSGGCLGLSACKAVAVASKILAESG